MNPKLLNRDGKINNDADRQFDNYLSSICEGQQYDGNERSDIMGMMNHQVKHC